jgi:hypothetical protein
VGVFFVALMFTPNGGITSVKEDGMRIGRLDYDVRVFADVKVNGVKVAVGFDDEGEHVNVRMPRSEAELITLLEHVAAVATARGMRAALIPVLPGEGLS